MKSYFSFKYMLKKIEKNFKIAKKYPTKKELKPKR